MQLLDDLKGKRNYQQLKKGMENRKCLEDSSLEESKPTNRQKNKHKLILKITSFHYEICLIKMKMFQ